MTNKDIPEVSWSDKIMAECIGEEPPPCQAACPLNIRVREKLRLIKQGNLTEALAVVLERCPFPGILGRICTHPCEAACTRNSLDQPIAVAGLKRYLADIAPDAVLNVAPGPDRPQPVAVVGVLQAKADAPSVLLLNDKFHPDWKVSVDGKPETLLRCNYVMRGVYLPVGSHTVEFRFEPPVNTLFVSLSAVAVGLALCGFLALSAWKQPSADLKN